MADIIPTGANDFIEKALDDLLSTLEVGFNADALCIKGNLMGGIDGLLRPMIEDLRKQNRHDSRLMILLTTNGGSIEVTRRIVDTIRYHYGHVGVVVPDYAFSAGTILAMSGDEIYMDYYSRLGPVDPQIMNERSNWVPALGYIKRYEALIDKANNGTLTAAEANLLIDGFDQAELYQFEQARDLSVELLTEWLAQYKFKDWERTEAAGTVVTPEKRRERAEEIARMLNDTDKWHTHGSGISMEVLRKDLNLVIDDLETDPERHDNVKRYYDLLSDYVLRIGVGGALHAVGTFKPLMFV